MGVTDVGTEEVVELIRRGAEGQRVSAINIGTDDTEFDPSDDSLGQEIDFEGARDTEQEEGAVFSIQATFSGNEAAIVETGLVCQEDQENAAQDEIQPGDVQFARQTIPEVNVLQDDQLDITFEVEVENVEE